MSTAPRRVLVDITVQWGEPGTPPLRVRHGSIVDVPVGSALEAAYGASNLSAVIPAGQRAHGDTLDKSFLSN